MERRCWVAAAGSVVVPPASLYSLLFLIAVVAASFDFVVKPEFGETSSDLNVTTFAGQTGRLPCTVKHLAGKRVSWIRGRDLQVLSTGRITFSTDLRISVLPGTTKFKSRKPRDVSHELSRECVLGLLNSTHGDPTDGDLITSSRDHMHHSHRPCLSSKREFPLDQDSSNNRQTNQQVANIFTNVSQDKNIQKSYLYNIRRRRNIRKQTYEKPSRTAWSRDRPVPNRSKRRGRREDVFKHWNTEYHHSNKGSHAFPNLLQHAGRAHAKPDYSSNKQTKTGEPQAYAQYNSPIAIYPQGPFTQGLENKGAQPGPNYIEGVWEPEDYTLQIKSIKPEDAGTYICQINTEPRISQVVHLNVVKMRAEIVGSKELYVKAGTPVTLACKVNHGTLMPGYILWYKGERLVEYDTSGGRIQVVTEADGVSHLLLKDAHPSDSANYTCSPSSGTPASLLLNVIVDERPAAMQQGNSAPHLPSSSAVLVLPAGVLASLITSITQDHSHPTTSGSTVLAVAGVLWWSQHAVSTLPTDYHWMFLAPAVVVVASLILTALICRATMTCQLGLGSLSRGSVGSRRVETIGVAPSRGCGGGVQQAAGAVTSVALCAPALPLRHHPRLQNYV